MTTLKELARVLQDPEVEKSFLDILGSDLSPRTKFDRLIEFLQVADILIAEVLSDPELVNSDKSVTTSLREAGEKMNIWKPAKILARTEKSIHRAIARILRCRHEDGGWGYQVEVSSTWATAHAMIALLEYGELFGNLSEVLANAESGRDWLFDHEQDWFVESKRPETDRRVYDASLVARCLCLTQHYFEDPLAQKRIDISLQNLADSQNRDGGWDATIWHRGHEGLIHQWSEVGATSTVIRSLAASNPPRFATVIQRGIEWLLQTQDRERGSWSDGSCSSSSAPSGTAGFHAPSQLGGRPSINKTCDAIRGILVATELTEPFSVDFEYSDKIDQAVDWIRGQEERFGSEIGVAGWGFREENNKPPLEVTCLVLETLVKVEGAQSTIPLLIANANWLLNAQYIAIDDSDKQEDGAWHYGDTFRITLSLVRFYKSLLNNPLFVEDNAKQDASDSVEPKLKG